MADGKETQRSLAWCRETWPGSAVEVVEHWNHHARKRFDLFGFGDILVVGPKSGLVIVQSTTKKQISPHFRKILGKPQRGDSNPEEMAKRRVRAAIRTLKNPGRIIILGWHQPGGPRTVWEVAQKEVTLLDFERERDR